MNFDEVYKLEIGFGLGVEAKVSGFITISENIIYLCASEAEQKNAILVIAPWLKEKVINEVSVRVGSMNLFSGSATITGRLIQTGLGLVPLAFYSASSVSLSIDGRIIEFRT